MLTSSSPTKRKTSSLAAATSIAPGVDHQERAEELGRAGVVDLVVRQGQQDQPGEQEDQPRRRTRRRR